MNEDNKILLEKWTRGMMISEIDKAKIVNDLFEEIKKLKEKIDNGITNTTEG